MFLFWTEHKPNCATQHALSVKTNQAQTCPWISFLSHVQHLPVPPACRPGPGWVTLGANASCHCRPLCCGARRSRSSLPGRSCSAALANCCPSVPFPARCFSGACSSKFSLYNSAAPSHREQLAAKRYRNVDLKPRKPIPSKHAAQLTARDVFLHYMHVLV